MVNYDFCLHRFTNPMPHENHTLTSDTEIRRWLLGLNVSDPSDHTQTWAESNASSEPFGK